LTLAKGVTADRWRYIIPFVLALVDLCLRQLKENPKRSLSLQELGWYDPLKKDTNLNAPAIKKWLEVGAKPSDTVESLLKKAMIMD
jgi:hypothetical protein